VLVFVVWEKFVKGELLCMIKDYCVVLCGVVLVIGCNIFLMWNFYFGLFVWC